MSSDHAPDEVTSDSSFRSALAYGFTALTLVAVTIVHSTWLPMGVQAAGHQFTNLIGQEHRWNLFSPDPRGTSVRLRAEIEDSDGSVSTWNVDDSVPGNEFRSYRWFKWMETVVLRERMDQLDGLSIFIANDHPEPVKTITWLSRERFRPDPGGDRVNLTSKVIYEWADGGR